MGISTNILTKSGFAALAIGAMVAFGGEKAEAATFVFEGGGPYDIISDNFFFGNASAGLGGAGSYSVEFTSSVDPVEAIANASVTVLVSGLFSDLIVEWVNTGTNAVLASELVVAPTTSIQTTFSIPNINQTLVFSWSDAAANAGFDFDVSAVPLPAGGLLLLSALGGVAALRRRRKTA